MSEEQGKRDQEFITNAFRALDPVEPSAQLSSGVASIPITYPRAEASAWWPFGRIWQPSLALVLAGLIGVFSGQYLGTAPPRLKSADIFEQGGGAEFELAVDPEFEEDSLEGLFVLATASDWQEDAWDLSYGDPSSLVLETLQP